MVFRRLRSIVLVLTILSVPVLVSVLVPPDEWFLAGMLALAIPLTVLYLLAVLIYFVVKKSPWALLPAGILLGAIPLLSSSFSLLHRDRKLTNSFRVATHNMNALKYYVKNELFVPNEKKFQDWAAKNNFDVLCLQEMIEVKKEPFLIPGYHRAYSAKDTRVGDHLGLFIFSKYPIVREGKMEFAYNSYNRLMWVDLAIGDDTIRVINVHLMSYDLKSYSIRKNLAKIRAGLRARSWHSKLIYAFLKESPYPVVLCGDFNETPVSYPYRNVNTLLNDAFAGSGKFFEYSFRFGGMPIRIDHIFTSPGLQATDYAVTHGVPWSDHSPVSARIGWPAQD